MAVDCPSRSDELWLTFRFIPGESPGKTLPASRVLPLVTLHLSFPAKRRETACITTRPGGTARRRIHTLRPQSRNGLRKMAPRREKSSLF